MKKHLLVILILFSSINFSFGQWGLLTAPSTLYPGWSMTSFNGSLLVSTNDGIYSSSDVMNWTSLTNGFGDTTGNAWRQVIVAGSYIYAGSTLMAVIRSGDNGSTWSYDTVGLETGPGYGEQQINALHYDINSDHLLASKTWPGYGLFYKKPSDAGWTKVNSNNIGVTSADEVFSLLSAGGSVGSSIYALTRSGIFLSIDGGVNWTQKNAANLPIAALGGSYTGKVLETDGINIFCATGAGLYKSSDQGDNWTRIDQGFAIFLSGLEPNISSIKYQNGNLYAGVIVNGGIDSAYMSIDAGMSWTDISEGLTSQVVEFIEFGGSLYAFQFGQDSLMKWGGGVPQGVEDEKNTSEIIQLFPNPATEKITILFNNWRGIEKHIRITDLEGRTIYFLDDMMDYQYTIPVQNFESGIYFIEARNEQNSIIRKFIKY